MKQKRIRHKPKKKRPKKMTMSQRVAEAYIKKQLEANQSEEDSDQ